MVAFGTCCNFIFCSGGHVNPFGTCWICVLLLSWASALPGICFGFAGHSNRHVGLFYLQP